MVSRQVQNVSTLSCAPRRALAGSVWRSASPAMARWKACECRLATAGSAQPRGVAATWFDMPGLYAGGAYNRRMDTQSRWDGLLLGRLATLDCEAGHGLVEDGALGWKDGLLAYAGPRDGLPGDPGELADEVIETDGLATPGLVDCHTHLVFAGDRATEFELRLQGAGYEEIARAGGGILSSVRAVREAGEDALLAQSLPRALSLVADGATTLEVKSGYGLDLANERKMLRVARRIGKELGIDVRTTYLAAHALPPEYRDDADGYIAAAIGWLHALHAEGLVDAVDAFCERIGFSSAQTTRNRKSVVEGKRRGVNWARR